MTEEEDYPSFDTSQVTYTPIEGTTATTDPMDDDKDPEEYPEVCPVDGKRFRNLAGKNSHMNIHDREATEKLENAYDSDIIMALIPRSGKEQYDPERGIWVYPSKCKLPEGFVIVEITERDVAHRSSNTVLMPKPFMKVLLARESKTRMLSK